MVEFTRASRDFDFAPGSGSSVIVAGYHPQTRELLAPVTLDIEQGFIHEDYINQDTPHSGMNGGPSRTRVGSDWNFALVLSFPARLDLVTVQQVVDGGALAQPFVQGILGSSGKVRMKFNIGDPLWWTEQGLPARNMQAAKALLSSVETRIEQRRVVGLNIAGGGSSLLWTALTNAGGADSFLTPGVWF